ncbi:MAG: hypothetical protein JSW20_08595 [Nitrospiraceae bacterium]|nr:MAG: hypothetical protein JSW20_08595 [Nitrospiraceae bacterium]
MKKTICLAVCSLFMVVLMAGVVLSGEESAADKTAAEQMTTVLISGTINDANQLVDNDGQTFDVADNDEGKKLLSHAGQKVQVTGTVSESEGKKQITVTAYEIMPEKSAH